MNLTKLLHLSWCLLLFFILPQFWPPVVKAQNEQCTLKLADIPAAPELLGFQMGMTREQVKLRVPQVKFGKTDDFGVSKTTINPYFDPNIDKTSFEGVRSISLDFLDDHLTSLWIGFDESYKVATVEEFVKKVSVSLHLPDAWSNWKSRGQQIRCSNFQLIVTTLAGGPSFRVLDLGAEDVVSSRREAKENEREAASSESEESPPRIYGDKRTKLYYSPGCELPKELVESDKLIFNSVEEAVKAGFKPAKGCQ
jgi:hypothetical protein